MSAARRAEGFSPRRPLLRTVRMALPRLPVPTTTLRMFRDDRFLRYATLFLSASALLPLTMTPILPLVDLGSNIGAASLLDDAIWGSGIIAQHYKVNLTLIPYWTVYLLIAVFEQFVRPLIAAKIVVGLAVVLLPVSVMRLLLALGRSPRLGLWAFVLSWDNNLYWGWITFQFGMVLALFVLAKLIELRTTADAWRLLPLTICVALTHLNAIALLLCAGGLIALTRRTVFDLPRYALALSGAVLPIVPWVLSKLGAPIHKTETGAVTGAASRFAFDMHTPETKLSKLFTFTLNNWPEAEQIAQVTFASLLLGCLLLPLLPQRTPAMRLRWASFAIFCSAAGLYFALPFAVSGPVVHWYTYPRYATYALIGLLTVPTAALLGRATLALLPVMVCAVALHYETAVQFRSYGEYVSPYLEIIARLPKNTRFIPLDFDDYRFRGTRQAVLGQLHGYAAAERASYDPHLFDEVNNPLLYRRDRKLPHPNWFAPSSFTMRAHGRYYDYVIVHPHNRDPLRRGRNAPEVSMIKEAGEWRLYKVKSPKEYAPRK